MDFDLINLSALCNAVETMSATAEDKGEEDFGVRLTHEDAKMIVRGLLLLKNSRKNLMRKQKRLKAKNAGYLKRRMSNG